MKYLSIMLLLFFASITNANAQASQIQDITATVGDIAATEAFYHDALGFEDLGKHTYKDEQTLHLLGVPSGTVTVLTMKIGDQTVKFEQFSNKGKAYPADSKSPDLWFQHIAIVVSDMDAAYARLKQYRFTPISTGGPQTLPASTGGVKAFKFRDPDRHPLEFIWFPEGQGRPVWHQKSADTLFLGIDHSAIGIASTPESLAFYQKLGFKDAYDSLNVGPTQQNLDGTWDAVVKVTGIRPSEETGPGIEFLDYRTPPTGRPMPVDMESNDIAHVHLTIKVNDIASLEKVLYEARVPEVSPGVVTSDFTDSRKSLLIRDPDGHALLLVE